MQLTKDIYISPASFTPAKYANQRRIELGKTQSKSIDDLQITFNNFLVNMGGNNQEVTADLTVKVKDGDTVQ
ncbi:MAG: hypothetical protein GWN16_04120, partial [Calditrichae bacterium]|nr:hypothetical protein [Calditrichia bacterium]